MTQNNMHPLAALHARPEPAPRPPAPRPPASTAPQAATTDASQNDAAAFLERLELEAEHETREIKALLAGEPTPEPARVTLRKRRGPTDADAATAAEWLDEAGAAEYCHLSRSWFAKNRMQGTAGGSRGPRYSKLGRAIRYNRRELDRFMLEHQVNL